MEDTDRQGTDTPQPQLPPAPVLSWWRKDKYGWPIEMIKGRSRFWRFTRILCQNIRKITG